MNKKVVLIIVAVLILSVIGVVIFMVMRSNKPKEEITSSSKTQTGLSNFLASSGGIGGLIPLIGQIKNA